ncbi:MAG: hypothetical protein B6D63_03980 [Candidatus Latescibacteria bacterium 4484_7]|nr:MAG: hypothetical protein B6D63_03980 [Candidatus Latescibacteria bacterium 4484_7]
MYLKKSLLVVVPLILILLIGALRLSAGDMKLDPYTMKDVFCRFPFAKVIPLDDGNTWGLMYADTYGKIHLFKATEKGWKLEWELTNLSSKVRNFFIRDVDNDGKYDIIICTFNGRVLVYSMDDYHLEWEDLEDNFSSIEAAAVANVDEDPQPELIILASKHIYIIDGLNKSRQWTSEREFSASEIIVENVDKDNQMEIVLNTGVIIDTRFLNVEFEWGKPFGDRIITFDMNNDGYPEIIGEFADYSLRIFDVYTQREVW